MSKRECWVLRIVAASLMAISLVNVGNVASQFELQVPMKYVYISMVSWGTVWLSGLVIAIVSIHDRNDLK